MKIALAAAAAGLCLGIQAAEAEGLEGLKVGGDIAYAATRYADRIPALGGAKLTKTVHEPQYRLFMGYDAPIGDSALIGAEVGLGLGGDSPRKSVGGGSVKINPGLSYDISVRVGLTPSPDSLAYVRAGYGWDRFKEKISAPGVSTVKTVRKTQGAPLVGVGFEQGFGDHLLLRAEFDYSGFSDKKRQEKALRIGGAYRF